MSGRKIISISVLYALVLFLLGFTGGLLVFKPSGRQVDFTCAEKCLRIFIQHKKSQDYDWLKQQLTKDHVEPEKFQKIVDRFLHYRLRQSSLNQAMELLEAFKAGAKMGPAEVVSRSDENQTSFALDAEILSVFKEKPELVKEAFGG